MGVRIVRLIVHGLKANRLYAWVSVSAQKLKKKEKYHEIQCMMVKMHDTFFISLSKM